MFDHSQGAVGARLFSLKKLILEKITLLHNSKEGCTVANYKKGKGGYGRKKRDHRKADGEPGNGRSMRLQARRMKNKSGRRSRRSANRSWNYQAKGK